jgi:hypothetical protein
MCTARPRCAPADQVLMAGVQCDLQRPFCNNCLGTRRICRGYQRYPVFLNRTASGLAKRRHFEEVKDMEEPPPSSHHLGIGQHDQGYKIGTICQPFRNEVVNWFYWEFVRSAVGVRFAPILNPILSSQLSGPLFKSSVYALSMTYFGRRKQDPSAYQRGQRFYILSLQQLQEAVDDPKKSHQEETLAAAAVLCHIEVSTTPQPSHIM